MRKIIILLGLALSLAMGCEQKTISPEGTEAATEKPSDPETRKTEVVALMDSFHSALKNKKANDFKNLLDPNGLYCGTDPTETHNRDTYAQEMAEFLNDPTIGTIAYTVDLRQIRVAEDGNSAVIVEQYKMDLVSPEIPWRLVSHAVRKDGVWILDFLSFTLVPTNAQQALINNALHSKA